MKHYKTFIVLLIVGFGVSLAYMYIHSLWRGGSSLNGQNEYLLIRPVFAQTSGSTFLEQEAGISIYMKVETTIDLTKAKTVYKNIEKETSEYIIGSISLPDLPETDDAHCFVHTAGWIVVYYLKTEPVGKIIDWNYYSDGVLTKTKLQVGLEKMALALGLSATDLKYYHFQYPYADKWTIIIETQPGYGSDSFRIKIPSTFTIYERSWTHNKAYGTLTGAQLSPDVYHTVTAEVGYYYSYNSYLKVDGTTINSIYDDSHSYVAIILVYKEA
ncbi:MAG: hypothetical protein QXK93_06800 [Candidatus Bathyarchaeia archaeon]